MNRDIAIQAISDRSAVWDCLVIGGGATGLGTALEAASRGYKTLLVEKTDFAKGTSSRATKLVHGGVRYLEQGNIALVREALYERGLLLRQLGGQIGTIDRGQDLPLGHGIAGMHLQRNGACRRGVERRGSAECR